MKTIIVAKPYNDAHLENKPVGFLRSLPKPGDYSFGTIEPYVFEGEGFISEGIAITSNHIQVDGRKGKLTVRIGHPFIDQPENWFPLRQSESELESPLFIDNADPDNPITVVWVGRGWYAPRMEGSHDSKHTRYYAVDGPDGEPGLGTPVRIAEPSELF